MKYHEIMLTEPHQILDVKFTTSMDLKATPGIKFISEKQLSKLIDNKEKNKGLFLTFATYNQEGKKLISSWIVVENMDTLKLHKYKQMDKAILKYRELREITI